LSGPIAAVLAALAVVVLVAAVVAAAVAPVSVSPRSLHYGGVDWAAFGVLLIAVTALAVLSVATRCEYRVHGTRREQVRQLGNAVTPPAAEWLIRAVTESLT
jgi:heme exporter protein D